MVVTWENVPLCLAPTTFHGRQVDSIFHSFSSNCFYTSILIVVNDGWHLRRACNDFLCWEPVIRRTWNSFLTSRMSWLGHTWLLHECLDIGQDLKCCQTEDQ